MKLSSKQKPKGHVEKFGILFLMLVIIRNESCPKQNQTLFEKISLDGHIVSDEGIQTVAKKFQDLKNLKGPENKKWVMRIFGSLDFYSTIIKKLHVDSKSFYELLKDDFPFK